MLAGAERAARPSLDLLGTGPFRLGRPADWQTDVRSGTTWPPAWWRDHEYAQLDRPSDVKAPGRSRACSGCCPPARPTCSNGDERHAQAVRETLEEWIEGTLTARA